MGVAKDLVGVVFSRLTVVELLEERDKHRRRLWKCVCECGNMKIVDSCSLLQNHTKSCGCLYKDSMRRLQREFTDKYKTHGWSGTPEHRAWKRIKSRTTNPNNEDYLVYSILGMEEEWKTSFPAFIGEIGEIPKDGQRWSVGRIDNTLGYVKGNIRWELDYQQAKNKGKYKNNSTGETGVHWICKTLKNGTETTYAVASWYDIDGSPRSKSFSVKKYGLMPAFALAVKRRREEMQKLKECGAPYGEHHGK